MKKLIGVAIVAVLAAGLGGYARAEGGKDATAIIDKAIKALGGEDKLAAVKAASWKSAGKISIMGSDNPFTGQFLIQGLDHLRQGFEGEFGGMKISGMTVLAGDKGWRKFNDMVMEMDKDAVAATKQSVYLQVIPMTVVHLKDKAFKVETAGEEKVDGKAAVVLKVTGPDGKDFKISFDKESGLPVKQVAKVAGFMGDEFTQETTYANYKDFDGIKKATKVVSKRDGEPFLDNEISDFKVLKDVDAKQFAEPK